MSQIFVTKKISEEGIQMLEQAGHTVDVSAKEDTLTKDELIAALKAKPYEAVLCMLTDHIDADVMDAAPTVSPFLKKERRFARLFTPVLISPTMVLLSCQFLESGCEIGLWSTLILARYCPTVITPNRPWA